MLNFNGVEPSSIHYGDKEPELWTGANGEWKKLHPSREVVAFSGPMRWMQYSRARRPLVDELEKRGLDYRTVEEIPFDLDLTEATDTSHLFESFRALKRQPRVIWPDGDVNMERMYQHCSNIEYVQPPPKAADLMHFAFWGCEKLEYIPDIDTSDASGFQSTLRDTPLLKDGNVRFIGRGRNPYYFQTIDNSGLTRLPFYDEQGNPI